MIETKLYVENRMKGLVLTEIIAPYRMSVFNALATGGTGSASEFLAETDTELRHWRVYRDGIDFLVPDQRVTVDEFLEGYGRPYHAISLIKIDVEGHENSVFGGMRRFLFERRPPLVVFEYLQRTIIEETLKFFGEILYQVFELTENEPVAVAGTIEPLQDLACPRKRMKAMGLARVAS